MSDELVALLERALDHSRKVEGFADEHVIVQALMQARGAAQTPERYTWTAEGMKPLSPAASEGGYVTFGAHRRALADLRSEREFEWRRRKHAAEYETAQRAKNGLADHWKLHRCPICDTEYFARSPVDSIRAAINDYYAALSRREHGGVAQDKAFREIERAVGMTWEDWKAAHKDAS